ncbi:MAG TPA: hypothetical protein VGH89_37130 [Pseudonocardia sp.]|jgi:hypothetical protein
MATHAAPAGHHAGDLSSVDLTDLELWAQRPPRELFARMRTPAPVRWNPDPDTQAKSTFINSMTSMPVRFTLGG